MSKIKLDGDGLEKAKVGVPARFTVDHSETGDAPLVPKILNADGSEVPDVEVKDHGDGTKT